MTEIHRHFLGWKNPFLLTSAKWLQEQYLDGTVDAQDRLLLLVPGHAVARRLQTIFVNEAHEEGRAVALPAIQTSSELFRFTLPQSSQIAHKQIALLSAIACLRETPQHVLQSILGPRPVPLDDVAAWRNISQRVLESIRVAAGGGFTLDRTSWPQEAQALLTEDAEQRFDLLHQVQQSIEADLTKQNLALFEQEQLRVLQSDSELNLENIKEIVIVGCADLSKATKLLLTRLKNAGLEIHSLIRAPESYQGGFDEYGCIDTNHWLHSSIDLCDADIIVAGSPSAQSAEVVRVLSLYDEHTTTDEITIISTDEKLIPILRRHLEGHGVHSRFSGGFPVMQTPEAMLLYGVAEFVATQSYDSYAALLRHPEIARMFDIDEGIYANLSRFSAKVLPSYIDENTRFQTRDSQGNELGLKELHHEVFKLLSPMIQCEQAGNTISHCMKLIRSLLLDIYGSDTLDRTSTKLKALQKIFAIIDILDGASSELISKFGNIKCSDAAYLVLHELEQATIPELPDSAAIDTVGWLEGMVADTPHLIVVGLSSDIGGSNNPSDAFFPDSLLEALGLESIDRRMSRDAHAITAMQQHRCDYGSVKWIVGRKSREGDPLSPSPLLLRSEHIDELEKEEAFEVANNLAKRSGELVASFDSEQPVVPPQFNPEIKGGGIQIPKPSEYSMKPLRQLSVTAFKDFLACSYRFWLKHVLKLESAEEGGSELDAKMFGSLIHKVLQRFGENAQMKTVTDPNVIEQFVCDELDSIVQAQLGMHINNKIRIQLELAKFRLRIFAKHQAECARDGWEIVCTERFLEKKVEVEEGDFSIRGVIDRVEIHRDGRIRILDYKTGSTTANAAHFTKEEWLDLQLPLYRELLSKIPELKEYDISKENVSLGYFKIGDQESTSGIDLLEPKDEIDAILKDTIESTIGMILTNQYSDVPATPAPKFSDTFSWICQDNSVVEESSELYG